MAERRIARVANKGIQISTYLAFINKEIDFEEGKSAKDAGTALVDKLRQEGTGRTDDGGGKSHLDGGELGEEGNEWVVGSD